jgi:predicted metal-binding protein
MREPMKGELFPYLADCLAQHNPHLRMVKYHILSLVFEERVKVKCFYCSRYNAKWTCPPRIPDVDYQAAMRQYNNAAFVICELPLADGEYEEIRTQSTNELHKGLLYLERLLWDNDNPMSLSFIGGSCKLCKNGCAPDYCRNPGLKRIPLEATGCNVIKSLAKSGIKVSFLPSDVMRRYGLILW